MTRPPDDLRNRAGYRFFDRVTMRFSDQDSLGHINNVSWVAYIEAGRIAYMMQVMAAFGPRGMNFVLANINIDYLKELHYPGEVEIGVKMLRVGGRSITTGYGAFFDGTCHATATCANVYFDPEKRVSADLPADLKAALEAEL